MNNVVEVGGDPQLYINYPPKVDYYDVFYFETRVRNMMEEFMIPLEESVKQDKQKAAKLSLDYNCLLARMNELECYAMIQEWKLKPSTQFYSLFNLKTG